MDTTKPSVSKRTVTCRKKSTSRTKSTSTVTQKISTVTSDRNTARRAASSNTKFVGRQIKHKWKLCIDSENTE
ncbi:hypothetical protein DPMN_086494 [Dreissena polymorpha]|uniref:Uncharacterized protein n=1 Tax=Dreissena polymorpha TaxID=45954 RepID=A0A9D4KQK0_DREPO|nr:hypothetical protein DPMN_086494 [Dreissena polymorpha]